MRTLFVTGAVSASFSWFAVLGFGAHTPRPVFARPASWRMLDGFVATIMLGLAASLIARLLPIH